MPHAMEPEPVAGLFETSQAGKRIARMLDKAVEKRIGKAARGVPRPNIRMPGGGGRKAQRSTLALALAKAIGVRRGGRDKPSLRMKASDTGGRAFHFEHTSVTKGEPHTASKKAKYGASTRGMGAAGAHLAYIERETAVEILQGLEERGRERELDPASPMEGKVAGRPRKRGRPSREELELRALEAERDEGKERAPGRDRDRDDFGSTLEGLGEGLGDGKGAAAQAYIENPAKMRNGELQLSSFGTIGDTYEERLRFWQLVEEHERAPDARIQNRLICELPHQSTPEARKEILERFVKPFADKGIPYHVAVHAPGAKNDARNFHAHVVFTERPAKRMVDPATGETEWDFAITEEYVTSSRNRKISHRHRQPKDRDLNKRTFVGDMRRHFAASVNAVMEGVDPSVKFDPRSYEAMGLGVAPVESVYRVTHDRMNDGKLVIQDVHWTRRMVAAKMREAALARDPDMEALRKTTAQLEALKAAWPHVHRVNARLGPGSRIASLGTFTKRTFVQVVNQRIALEQALARERVVAKAELAVCREVMEATRVQKVKGVRRRDLRTPEEQEEVRVLFDVAKEEHAALSAQLQGRTFKLNALILANKAAWKATAEALVKPVKAARAPEKPDPRTGKVMFEPDLAARAGRRPVKLAEDVKTTRGPGARPDAPRPAPVVEGPGREAPKKEREVGRMIAGDAAPRAGSPMLDEELRRTGQPRLAPARAGEAAKATTKDGAAKEGAAKKAAAKPAPTKEEGRQREVDEASKAVVEAIEATMRMLAKPIHNGFAEQVPGEAFKPFDKEAFMRGLGHPTIESLRQIERMMGMEEGEMSRFGAPEAPIQGPAVQRSGPEIGSGLEAPAGAPTGAAINGKNDGSNDMTRAVDAREKREPPHATEPLTVSEASGRGEVEKTAPVRPKPVPSWDFGTPVVELEVSRMDATAEQTTVRAPPTRSGQPPVTANELRPKILTERRAAIDFRLVEEGEVVSNIAGGANGTHAGEARNRTSTTKRSREIGEDRSGGAESVREQEPGPRDDPSKEEAPSAGIAAPGDDAIVNEQEDDVTKEQQEAARLKRKKDDARRIAVRRSKSQRDGR